MPSRDEPLHRIGYAWQVPVFDAAKHVVIRYWCERNNVDIVDFWLRFYPSVRDDLDVFEAVNPRVYEEMEEGSFSPTRRCIRKDQLYMLRNEFLGANEPVPMPQDFEEVLKPKPQPRLDHDSPESGVAPVEWNIHDGVRAYDGHGGHPARWNRPSGGMCAPSPARRWTGPSSPSGRSP